MSDLDFLYERVGDVEFPAFARDVTNGQLYSVCDPATDLLIALFKAAINQELAHHQSAAASDSPWAATVSTTVLVGKMPVQDTLYQAPTKDVLRRAKFEFPLLCVYRVSFEDDQRTLWRERTSWTWGVDYILGPLEPEEQRKLGAALTYVHHLLSRVVEQRGHAAYESGAVQFGTGKGGFDDVRILRGQQGAAEFGEQGEGLIFHALHLELQTTELDSSIATETPLGGVSMSFGVGGGEGVVPDMAQAETEHPGEKLDALVPSAD